MNSTTRSHPIGQMLSYAALGQAPTDAELAALKVSPSKRQRIADVARDAVALKRAGQHGDARRLVAEHAQNIIAELPEPQQDPAYLKPRSGPDESFDPVELAARVQRW